jgi:hypothetical protein
LYDPIAIVTKPSRVGSVAVLKVNLSKLRQSITIYAFNSARTQFLPLLQSKNFFQMIQLKVPSPNSTPTWPSPPILTNAQTLLNCIDNSGAAIVECIKVLKMKRAAKIGKYSPIVFPPSRYPGTISIHQPKEKKKLTNSQETA